MNAELTPEQATELAKRRKRNSIALGLVLGFLVLVFYALTIIKLGPNVFENRF